jgi:hypothetical protein
MGKAATVGAATAAISFGIGSAANALFTSAVSRAVFQAGMHGLSGGIMSSVEGGNFLSGFASGAISSLISSAVKGFAFDKSGELTNFGKSGWSHAAVIAQGDYQEEFPLPLQVVISGREHDRID